MVVLQNNGPSDQEKTFSHRAHLYNLFLMLPMRLVAHKVVGLSCLDQ